LAYEQKECLYGKSPPSGEISTGVTQEPYKTEYFQSNKIHENKEILKHRVAPPIKFDME